MSDDTATPTETADPQPPAAEPAPTDPPAANLIGEAQRKQDLDKALAAAKAAEKDATVLRSKLEKLEGEKLSDLEKQTNRAERAEQKATELEQRAITLERSGWVRDAAQKAGFADPGDAVAFLDLTALDDDDKVKEAVVELQTAKPHLVAAQAGPTPIGGLTGGGSTDDIPLGEDGKPNHKAGLGRELAKNLLGR